MPFISLRVQRSQRQNQTRKAIQSRFILGLGAFILLGLSACLHPPQRRTGEVIDPNELFVISHLRNGNDYAAAGRFDFAEREFRLVLAKQPSLVAAQNDLGYVVLALNRPQEAAEIFQRVLQSDKNNTSARENLARALYRLGDLDAARTQFETLRDSYEERMAKKPTPPEIAKQLARTYRNLAILDYLVGELGDARCWSALAMQTSPSADQTGQHVRLLLSLDDVAPALALLATIVPVNAAPEFLADYALALYVSGQKAVAEQAAIRVLGNARAEAPERRIARFLRVFIAKAKQNVVEQEQILADLDEERSTICNAKFLERQTYWPTAFFQTSKEFLISFCEGESGNEHPQKLS